MGRIARAKSGLYHGGGYVPIGYNYQNGKLVINPYEAEQVKKIFKWYLGGKSLFRIAEQLQNEGYSNRYGSWNSWSSVRNVIENAVYTGRMKYGGIIVENAHEALVSDEQFKAAQIMRKQRREQYGKHGFQSKHLLTGMLICGFCGARYYFRKNNGYLYYCCYSRTKQVSAMVKNSNCKNKIWRAAELESLIDKKVREMLASPQAFKEIAKINRPKPVIIENTNTEKRIKEIDKQISKLMELYQLDKIPPELLGENIDKLHHEKLALQKTLATTEESSRDKFEFIESLIRNAAQIWDFADDKQKRKILQGLIKRIILTDDEVRIEWNF